MDTLLTILAILGIAVLAFLLILLVLGLWLVLKVRRLTRELPASLQALQQAQDAMAQAQGAMAQAQPTRIHLKPEPGPAWKEAGKVQAAQAELARLGYQPAGDYVCAEMPALRLAGLFHPGAQLYAVIYEMAPIGVWCDVVARFAEGGSLTCTNSPHAGVLDPRPGHDKRCDPLLDIAALHRLAMDGIGGRACRPCSAEAFAADCEAAYADETDWRTARGAPTEEEMRRVAERNGQAISDQDLRTAAAMQRTQWAERLRGVLLLRLREAGRIPAGMRSEYEERLRFVHDRMTAEEVDELVREAADPLPEAPAAGTARQRFRALNDALPPARRFTLHAELAEPLPAEAWLPPDAES